MILQITVSVGSPCIKHGLSVPILSSVRVRLSFRGLTNAFSKYKASENIFAINHFLFIPPPTFSTYSEKYVEISEKGVI